ncbi:MAG: hypothetical protein ACE5F7_08925, partial [Nitrospiria bacterium]
MAKDAHFPQMPDVLNMARMREIFQDGLWNQGKTQDKHFVVQACHLGERRYKPGKSCVLTYRLTLLNQNTKTLREQIFCARLSKAGEGLAEFQRAARKTLAECDGVPPIAYFPALEMTVRAFPNDRKLTRLPEMLDPSFLRDFLPKQLTA